MENIEMWKPCLGFEDYLEASNLGIVKSKQRIFTDKKGRLCLRSEKILTPNISKNGYYRVFTRINHKGYNLIVSRLVYEAFNGKIPKGMQVNHIDEDKSNNKLSNLNILTPKDNANFGTRNERIGKSVNQIDIFTNNVIETYCSIKEASLKTGICCSNIGACCKNKHNTAGGYKWSYAR